MGARAPPSTRSLRSTFKCEFCGRHLMSLEKLRSHQRVLHAASLKQREKRLIVLKESKIALKKKIVPTKSAKLATKSAKTATSKPQKVVTTKANIVAEKDLPKKVESPKMATKTKSGVKASENRRTEFKCPQCDKVFPVFFSAQRHIQKNHRVKNNNEKGLSNSHSLLEPISIEYCPSCNTKYSGSHFCTIVQSSTLTLQCSSCDQRFDNMKLFDVHVSSLHSDGLENMFFPSNKEFLNWKQQMETQTKTKYLIMGKYDSKQIYRCCNIENNDEESNTVLCPSTIVFQEFAKGAQVTFYKNHEGHTFNNYVLKDKYKSYCITNMLQQAAGYTAITDINSDDNDLYLQFKTLMESIVLDAAKINIDTLKILIGKALDMTSVLTQYDEDAETEVTNDTSTLSLNKKADDQIITQTLEGLRSSMRIKRKSSIQSDTPQKVSKKTSALVEKTLVSQKTKTKNTFSLADDKDSVNILKELDSDSKNVIENKKPVQNKDGIENATQNTELESPKVQPKVTFDQSPSSFNDSYKDFIDKTLKTTGNKKGPERRKQIVKTKIGQFKPTSPKETPILETKRSGVGKVKDVEYEVKTPTLENTRRSGVGKVKDVEYEVKTPTLETKRRSGVGKEKDVEYEVKTPTLETKRRSGVGKEKDVEYEVKTPTLETKRRSGVGKVKDVEYEVKERENDCNILILKI